MATTKKFYVTKDARIARRESDNWDSGSGTSDGLPYGLYSGYRYRVLLGFSISMTGWTSITSAYLNYRSSNQIHIGFGSDPTFKVQRLTGSWSEGSSSGLSASNAVVYPGPSASGTNEVIEDAPTAESTWGSVNITAMMRDVLNGQPFTGLRLLGVTNAGDESDSSANVGEIFSREQGSDAYIEITYETNTAPTTALSIAGLSGGIIAAAPANLSVTPHDAENDLINQIETQIASDAGFAALIHNVTTAMANVADDVAYNIPVTGAYTAGTTYYARARSRDENGAVGGWSSTVTFKIATAPTVTVTEPSAAGRLGKVTYSPGLGWASPRLEVDWTFTCPDGGTQQSYRVEVNADSAGSPGASINDSGTVVDAAARQRIVPATLTEGAYIHVRVTATCSHGLSTVVAYRRVRVRWGVITHRHDMGTPPANITLATLDVTDSVSGGGQGRVAIEYATTTTTGAPTTWAPNVAGAGRNRYFWYRAWLLVWGASPAVSPSLNQLKITYDTTVIVPDIWVRQDAGNEFGDVASFVYGTKSLKMQGTGAVHRVTQLISVVPRTDYVLSARVASLGNSGAYVSLAEDAVTSAPLVQSDPVTSDREFDDATSAVKTAVWNSGENTEVYVRCVVTGAVGTQAWFDAIKLEASAVVSPWQPGFIAPAVILDSGGVQIDGSLGGLFRLRAGDGIRTIELNADGLKGAAPYVGPNAPTAPWDGQLWWDTDDIGTGSSGSGTSFPAGPTDGQTFYRTDLRLLFTYKTSIGKWLGPLMRQAIQAQQTTSFSAVSTVGRVPVPKGIFGVAGSRMWVEGVTQAFNPSAWTPSGSLYWNHVITSYHDDGSANVVIDTTQSNQIGVVPTRWQSVYKAVGLLLAAAVTNIELQLATGAGAPGALYIEGELDWSIAL